MPPAGRKHPPVFGWSLYGKPGPEATAPSFVDRAPSLRDGSTVAVTPPAEQSDNGHLHVLLTGNTTFKIANFRQGLIRRLLAEGHRVSVLSPPDEYVGMIRALGCSYVPLALDRKGTSPVAEASLLIAIAVHLRRMRPDVVLSYTIKNNLYAGIVCRMLGIPFVPNVTGLGPAFSDTGPLNLVVRLLYRLAFKKARAVFFQNSHDLSLVTAAGLCRASIARLLPGSGVDLQQFAERPLREAADEEVHFLLVARMLWDKGVSQFIDAAREVRRVYPKTRFQLLGPLDPGSSSGIPGEQIEAWVAEGVAEYLGNTQDVRPFMERAHCVVLPSHYREGTPRALLEACATGRPIITTDMPGCRDVVRDKVNGILIPPKDVGALVEACCHIVRASSDQRSEMGRAGRKIAETHYDERFVIGAYFDILSEL